MSLYEPDSLTYGSNSSYDCNAWVYSFAAIWRRSVETTPELLLTEQETQTLAELGFSLGRYDAKEQSNALSYTIRRMEIFLQKAEAQRDKDSKTQAFLGVAAGVFAVIILL